MTPIGEIVQDLGTDTSPAEPLHVRYQGNEYAAEPVSGGAAYEIFAAEPLPGFLPNRRPGAHQPFRRFVPACDVDVVRGAAPRPAEHALSVPVFRDVSWASVHGLSQVPRATTSQLLATVRGSIDIQRGTRTTFFEPQTATKYASPPGASAMPFGKLKSVPGTIRHPSSRLRHSRTLPVIAPAKPICIASGPG